MAGGMTQGVRWCLGKCTRSTRGFFSALRDSGIVLESAALYVALPTGIASISERPRPTPNRTATQAFHAQDTDATWKHRLALSQPASSAAASSTLAF